MSQDAMPAMTDDTAARLRALAEAAPKGPWTLLGAPDDAEPHMWTIVASDGLWTAREPVAEFHKLRPEARALQAAAGRYIAAASPDVVTALLDALDEARQALDDTKRIEGMAFGLATTDHERAVYWKARAKSAEGKLRPLTRERDAAVALLREARDWSPSVFSPALRARIDAMLGGGEGA